MALITVEGIKVFAYHGHLPEEAVLGGHFLVNTFVESDTEEVENSDNLNDTVDYVKIISIVHEQMEIRSNMIEHAARRIANSILQLDRVREVTIELEKLLPPIHANFGKISVTLKVKN